MDAVALASVITSGVVGISGIGAALWTSRQAATLAREARSQERLANAYLEVLGMVELEGQWFLSSADNLVARTDPYFSGTPASLSKPELAKRSRARALLGAFGSAQVKQRYLAWTLAAASIDEDQTPVRGRHDSAWAIWGNEYFFQEARSL